MSTKTDSSSDSRREGTVVVVGGSGGMSRLYREVAEKQGLELKHYEKRMPQGARRGMGKIALIVVMVGMVSHALLDQVETLPLEETEVVYLRTASVSALKAALAKRTRG